MTAKDNAIKALLIEDDPEDTMLLMDLMARPDWPSFRFVLECAETLEEGVKILAKGEAEVILLDLMLPDSRGMEGVLKLHRLFPDMPIVVLTGLSDENMGLEAVRNGAQDYQIKGSLDGHAFKRTISFAVERHRLLAELRQVEQLRAEIKERQKMDKLKDELISAVSHEMRSPLTIVKAAADNLKDGLAGPLSEPQNSLVWLQHKNILRLEKIVEGILNLSRLESGKAQINPRRVDVAPLLRDTVHGFRLLAGGNLNIEEDLPQDLPPLHADPDLFVQVLSNLIDNALRYAKARVVIKAASVVAAAAGAAARARPAPGAVVGDRPYVQISVSDDGPGISRECIGDLFNKYVQVNRSSERHGYKGTGLGLAICKEIVERQGGRIWVESGQGKGAVFHFCLPQWENQAESGGGHDNKR